MSHRHFVSVEGTLRLEGPRSGFELRAQGPELHLEAERARGLLDLARVRRAVSTRSWRRALAVGGLDLSVGLAGLEIARVPAGSRLRIHPIALLRALGRRLSAA